METKTTHCSFIENKNINYNELEKILFLSKKQNHWANFGPVTKQLEKFLHKELKVNQNKATLMCKSATDGLFILANLKAIKKERPLKWLVSSFGFFSTNIGPLHDSIIIDCDKSGFLDLNEVKKLESNTWDGLIVTNVFGLSDNLSEYVSFCQKQGKEIIIDNAVSLDYGGRKFSNHADEVISFHQTKPWGIGEGGCIIVDKNDKKLVKSLMNFGADLDNKYNKYCINSKLPDFNSALILQRLKNRNEWGTQYQKQSNRLLLILNNLGLTTLKRIPKNKLMGNLPILHDKEVTIDSLIKNSVLFDFGKYYRPLSPLQKTANKIYNNIFNIPCHSGLEALSDDEIMATLTNLLNLECL